MKKKSIIAVIFGIVIAACLAFMPAKGQTVITPNLTYPLGGMETERIAYRYYDDSSGRYQIKYDYSNSFATIPATYPAGPIHYHNTLITVYKQIGANYIMLCDNMYGCYVPAGCFEDVPSEWVKSAKNCKLQDRWEPDTLMRVGDGAFSPSLPDTISRTLGFNGWTVLPRVDSVMTIKDDGIFIRPISMFKPKITIPKDYIPVIMLVSDTCNNNVNFRIETSAGFGVATVTMRGYKVTTNKGNVIIMGTDLKPLSDCFVVWMSKEIKP